MLSCFLLYMEAFMVELNVLEKRLANLYDSLLIFTESSPINNVEHFGKNKYIIFISVTEGQRRAEVYKAVGNTIETSW